MCEDPFLRTVKTYIGRHHLMDSGKVYLVALSGGADSVCLLLSLLELGYYTHAVHCNFHLRGRESDRDEEFCRALCEEHGLVLHTAHFATRDYASVHHVSIEMAARTLRYDYFEKLRQDIGADDIVVAHHRDDSAETILLNFIRGTGVHGLTGISPRRDHVVRPLLCVGRAEIEGFLRSRQQSYVTDSTNLSDDAMRNKIRLHVIPAMQQINPSVTDAILMTASRLEEVSGIVDDAMKGKVDAASLPCETAGRKKYDIGKIDNEHTLFYMLHPLGFSPAQIQHVFSGLGELRQGAIFTSLTHELLIDRGMLIIQPIRDCSIHMRLPIEGKYIIGDDGYIRVEVYDLDRDFVLSKDAMRICVDADKVSFPLYLRNVAMGDRWVPFGMKGSKLVSDFMTDQKMNLFDKRAQWVLTDGDDRIVWLVGHRIDHRRRITPSTQRVLEVTVKKSSLVV